MKRGAMNLYTRCAHCDTTFRVTTQQLQASSGQVRCGHCQAGIRCLCDADRPGASACDCLNEKRLSPSADRIAIPRARPSKSPRITRPPIGPRSEKTAQQRRRGRIRPPACTNGNSEMPEAPPPHRSVGECCRCCLLAAARCPGRVRISHRTDGAGSRNRRHTTSGCANGWAAPWRCRELSSYLHIEASDLKAPDPSRPSEIELLIAVRNRAPVRAGLSGVRVDADRLAGTDYRAPGFSSGGVPAVDRRSRRD